MLEGYQKCTKGIGKLKKLSTAFQLGIKNNQRVSDSEPVITPSLVSEILGGYQKCTKGIGKLKN